MDLLKLIATNRVEDHGDGNDDDADDDDDDDTHDVNHKSNNTIFWLAERKPISIYFIIVFVWFMRIGGIFWAIFRRFFVLLFLYESLTWRKKNIFP